MQRLKQFLFYTIKLTIAFSIAFAIVINNYSVLAYEGHEHKNVKGLDEDKVIKEEIDENNESYASWKEKLTLSDFYLGDSTIEVHDRIEADLKLHERLYKENPDGYSTVVTYGLELIDLNEIEKATIVWEKAAKVSRGLNSTINVYKAWVDALNSDYLAAKNVWYQLAMEKEELQAKGLPALLWISSDVNAVLGLYLISDYLPDKDKKEARDVVFKIANRFKNNPRFTPILVNEDLQNGRLVSAEKRLVESLSAHPNEPILLTLVGITHLLRDKNEKALEFFNKSDELYSYSPTNHLMKARAEFASSKKKESKKTIKKAFKLNPRLKKFDKKELLSAKSYILKR